MPFGSDPLVLVSSVFVKKPERIVALALVMVLCLLVYQTIKSQVNKSTDRPTMRWMFPCFAGGDLLPIRHDPGPDVALVLRLQPLHQQVLTLLGPAYEQFYKSTH